MAFPAPLILGTFVFILFCVLGGVGGIFLRRFKKLNKDETQ
jgi:hypothetical protein